MVTKGEWRWLTICTALLIMLLAIPPLWGWRHPPAGWQLYRTWAYGGDYTQYRAAMDQGARGAWLIVNRFTPEPHHPILQYPLYVVLGHIARWLHLPLEVPYALATVVAIIALAFALYVCAAAFLPTPQERKLAFLLTLSIGPAWLISLAQALAPAATFLSRYQNAFNRPEVNTFLLFAAAPHLPLALAILLWVLAQLYRHDRHTEKLSVARFLLSYGLPALLLGLLNPFSLPTLLLPLGLWWVVRSVQARRILWQQALPIGVMGVAVLPLVAYNAWMFSQDPFWGKAYGSQNYQISFPPDVVLMGFGVMGILALAGAIRTWRSRPMTRFLTFWAIVVLLLGYLPVNYQRRFSLGLAPILAILAVAGWRFVAQSRHIRRWWQRMATRVTGSVLLIMLLWGQNIIYYSAYAMAFLGQGPTPFAVFQPRALAKAAAYLDGLGDDVVVLTCEEIGNLLAGEMAGRVVLGHSGATLDVAQRREDVRAFFDNALPADAWSTLLKAHHVSHILTSDLKPLQCGTTYEPALPWHPVFDREGVTIYAREP